MRRALVLLSAAALSGGALTVAPPVVAAPPPSATAAAEPASVPNELLVGFAPGASARDRADARSRAGARLVEVVVPEAPGRSAVELVAAPAGGRGESERRFEADPKVDYAEPNWVYQHASTSNDPLYLDGSLWGAYGDATSPANPYGSQAGEAWATGNTGGDVYIGVIDEGIEIGHPDLAANIWQNPREAAGTADVDDDGNGHVDDLNGWDFDGNDNTVYDGPDDNHGTHVAGTIGATGGNGAGVAGVAWNVTLIPTKFLGLSGGTTANAVKAVDYLTNLKKIHGINLVATNNSWGGGGFSQGLHDAIERANLADILFVAAAGNGGSDGRGDNNDKTPHYPSSYGNTNVIAVASLTSSGAKSTFSNYGATSVDLYAPGSGIWSTVPGGTYASYNGTSMATPHVSGAAALFAAWQLGASATTIKNGIMTSTIAMSLPATVSGGRLDAGGFATATVSEPDPDGTPPAPPSGLTATGGDARVDLTWTENMESDLAGYEIYRDAGTEPVATVNSTATSWTDSGLTNGQSYTYYVKAFDTSGNRSDASLTASAVPNAAAVQPLTLTATGYKVKGLQQVDVSWSGGDTNATVTVHRTGTSSADFSGLPTPGSLTDKIGKKGSGTYDYRLCQGENSCSSPVTVVF